MLRLIAAVAAVLALGALTTVAFACNDSASNTPNTPPPQVQAPPADSQT